MKTLSILVTCVGLASVLTHLNYAVQSRPVSVHRDKPAKASAGYYFSLRDVPLSQQQYIFQADPLKKAVFVDGDRNVSLSHTMTVKNGKGFDMYFSGMDYNVILAIKEARVVDEGTTEYKGTLMIRHSTEKHKYAVHGFQNR